MADLISQVKSLPSLTEETALEAIVDFFRDKPFVVFGSGMSCALDPRLGVSALEEELVRNVRLNPIANVQQSQWTKVLESLNSGSGLEVALDDVTDSSLLQEIMRATGRFISSIDRECALQIAEGSATWPATALIRRLVDKLPEGDPILHVLTTNYDTLFEHACDAAGIHYTCGYSGGLQRRIDWSGAIQSLLLQQISNSRRNQKIVYKQRKHVRLYKAHGSLNLFFHHNSVIENNAWMWKPPDFAQRVIITPGLSKYQLLQNYRQELLKSGDAAIEKANRFLFLGYGFNDTHLETYITRKLINQSCRGLIVTRDSNPRIESLLDRAENLWAVCKLQEDDAFGTRIFNKKYGQWLELPTKKLWDIATFKTEYLGG